MAATLSLRGFRVSNRESLKFGYFERRMLYSFERFRFERSRYNILKFSTFRNELEYTLDAAV